MVPQKVLWRPLKPFEAPQKSVEIKINLNFSLCPGLRRDGLILIDYEPFFDDMLSTLNQKTIYQPCISVLLTKNINYLNGFSYELIGFYLRQNHYNLRNSNVFTTDHHKLMLYSTIYREK